MSTWKYMENGQPMGPVDTSALLALLGQGKLNADSLVQKEGNGGWVPIRSVPELAGAPAGGGPLPASPALAAAPGAALVPGVPEAPDPADVEKNKVFAILAYIGLLFLVPLLAAPQSKFARYHANQGIVLFLAALIVCVGGTILSFVPVLGCFMRIITFLAMAGAFVLAILGIINAANGQCKPLPLLGGYTLLK